MTAPQDNPAAGILFIICGIFVVSINDMLIKLLSGGYPLHEIIFARSFIALLFSLAILQGEGGWASLRTRRPLMHLLRGCMVVTTNVLYYAAMAVLTMAQTTALFYVAPLFITLLSVPLLGEKVGLFRTIAVAFGLAGVVVMMRPWESGETGVQAVMLLPIAAAAIYATTQVMARKLGVDTKPSAMAIYGQSAFLIMSIVMFLAAGDGRFANSFDNPALRFLLRPWIIPQVGDLLVFVALGACSGIAGYCLSAAYRIARASTVAPFEYVSLPMAVFWGWTMFEDWPQSTTWIGFAMIVGSGVVVFLRERQKNLPPIGPRRRALRR